MDGVNEGMEGGVCVWCTELNPTALCNILLPGAEQLSNQAVMHSGRMPFIVYL